MITLGKKEAEPRNERTIEDMQDKNHGIGNNRVILSHATNKVLNSERLNCYCDIIIVKEILKKIKIFKSK